MMFPHSKREPEEFGHCPGNGITCIPLSRDPLATEGEATPGPDDHNPFDEREYQQAKQNLVKAHDPTKGKDPFVFDDVEDEIGRFNFPSLNLEYDGPRF